MRDDIKHDDPCDDCTGWIEHIPEDILLRPTGPAVRSTEDDDLESEAERLIRLSLGAGTVSKRGKSI